MLRIEHIASSIQQQQTEYYDFVVIGSGISGVQAAEILALEGKSVVVLEANDYIGGRIRTEQVGSLPQAAGVQWIRKNPKAQSANIEHGATWLSHEHTYALQWIKQLGLSTYLQYNDGICVYGRHENQYIHVDNLREVYLNHKQQIVQVLNSVVTLINNLKQLVKQVAAHPNNPIYQKMYSEYIHLYDNMNVKTYLQRFLKDKTILQMVMHAIEVQECVPCESLSVFNMISGSTYSLDNMRVYLGLDSQSDLSDALKIREGFDQVVYGIVKKAQQHRKKPGLVKLSEPVLEIRNEANRLDVQVVTSKSKYRCFKVIWSVPIATSHLIKISRLSQSKRMFFANQQYATAVKLFVVFKRAFWRSRFCGNAYFSEEFPFSELIEVSPANLNCGILAFFFCADKINQWEKRFGDGLTDKQIYNRKKQYVLKVIADMFLDGDIGNPELADVVMAERSYRNNKFIRSCYQSISRVGLTAQIESKFFDSTDCRTRDEYNIIFVGSELGEEFGTYVEGAIRYSRAKIYRYLSKVDPWSRNN